MTYNDTIKVFVNEKTYLEIYNIEKYSNYEYSMSINLMSYGFGVQEHVIYFNDLSGIISKLEMGFDKLSGDAGFRHQYEDDFISFEHTKHGHIRAYGNLFIHAEYSQKLEFEFDMDQTYISDFIKNLKSVVKSLG